MPQILLKKINSANSYKNNNYNYNINNKPSKNERDHFISQPLGVHHRQTQKDKKKYFSCVLCFFLINHYAPRREKMRLDFDILRSVTNS